MESFAAVIDAFGGPGPFQRATGISDGHARTMKARESIPPEYWPEIVAAAAREGIPGITFETLARLAARKRGREDASGSLQRRPLMGQGVTPAKAAAP